MLEALENFMAPIAHDLAEPHVAVHIHKQRALADAHRGGVFSDRGVDQLRPHLADLRLALALLQPELLHHRWHEIRRGACVIESGLFLLSEINTAPLGQNTTRRPRGRMSTGWLDTFTWHQRIRLSHKAAPYKGHVIQT